MFARGVKILISTPGLLFSRGRQEAKGSSGAAQQVNASLPGPGPATPPPPAAGCPGGDTGSGGPGGDRGRGRSRSAEDSHVASI